MTKNKLDNGSEEWYDRFWLETYDIGHEWMNGGENFM